MNQTARPTRTALLAGILVAFCGFHGLGAQDAPAYRNVEVKVPTPDPEVTLPVP